MKIALFLMGFALDVCGVMFIFLAFTTWAETKPWYGSLARIWQYNKRVREEKKYRKKTQLQKDTECIQKYDKGLK